MFGPGTDRNKRQTLGEDAGLVHLPGLDAHDHQTFCGHCWMTGAVYEDTTDPATCPGCLRAAEEAHQLLGKLLRQGLWLG